MPDRAVPRCADGAVQRCADGAVQRRADGAVPRCVDGAAPRCADGAVPQSAAVRLGAARYAGEAPAAPGSTSRRVPQNAERVLRAVADPHGLVSPALVKARSWLALAK